MKLPTTRTVIFGAVLIGLALYFQNSQSDIAKKVRGVIPS